MKDIVSVIREICEPENGFVDLFNQKKSYSLLSSKAEQEDAYLFGKLLYGKARKNLIEMIKDSYQYEKFSSLILEDLQADGLTAPQALSALEIFFKAFGYPGYRDALQNPVSEFISYDSGNFKIKHKGETKNGKEYGIGRRDNFYEGKSCGFDECNWIDGRMIGYCYSLEVEMEAFETKKYGFVLNDYYVGKYMLVYEDGTEEYMIGKPFPVQ